MITTTTYKVRRIPRSNPVCWGVYEIEESWAGKVTTRWYTVYHSRAEAEAQTRVAEGTNK